MNATTGTVGDPGSGWGGFVAIVWNARGVCWKCGFEGELDGHWC